jgi:hypothetical protein
MSKSRYLHAISRSGIPNMLRDELRRHGIPDSHIEAGKHPALVFHVGQRRLRFTFPSTPSCPRSALNAVASLRRYIREAQQ